MKPNFILELSQTGVRLRAATAAASDIIGEVALSDSEFDAKLAALRNQVAEKSDEPLATELRIPDSEILYTTLDDPKAPEKSTKEKRAKLRAQAVRDALEGMTPYALSDLNFTWKIKGKGELCVAAVAHETLAEAEEFAASRRFNPVRFAAQPGKDKFNGVAQFGPTATQKRRTEIEAREKAEAEERAKAEAAAAAKPTPPPPAPKPAPEPKKPQSAATSEPAPVKAASDTKENPGSAGNDSPVTDKKPVPAQAKAETAAPKSAPGDQAPPAKSAAPTPAAPQQAGPTKDENAEKPPVSASPPVAKPATAAPAKIEPPKPEAKDPAKTVETPRVGFSQPRINDPLPPMDEAKPAGSPNEVDDVPPMPVSFASRRKAMENVSKPAPRKPGGGLAPAAAADDPNESRLSRIAARFAVTPGSGDATPPPPPRRTPPPGAKTVMRGSAAEKPGAPRPAPPRPAVLPDTTAAAASLSPIAEADRRPPATSGPEADGPRAASTGKLNEAEAMTVFGARNHEQTKSFAPLLIGIAVAAILAVGVWTAFLLLGGDQTTQTPIPEPGQESAVVLPPETPIDVDTAVPESEPSETVAPPPPDPIPTEEPEAADFPPTPGTDVADLPESAPDGEALGGRATLPDSTVATLGPIAPEAPRADNLPETEAPPPPLANDPLQRPPSDGENPVARYATTGIWVDTPGAPEPPAPDRVDDIYVAALDPNLPDAARGAAPGLDAPNRPRAPMPQLPPAPPGQTFDLDDRGLVRATPEGTISPDGILITAGRPDRTPPARPNRPASLTPTAENQPDLPRINPRDRPTDLVDDNEQTNLIPQAAPETAAVEEDTQLAALQPRSRPEDIAPTVAPEDELSSEDIQDRARAAALSVAGASTATPQAPLRTPVPRQAPVNLAALRPAEPEVAPEPAVEEETAEPEPISPYAVAKSRLPKGKPRNFDSIVKTARARAPKQEQQVTRVAAPAAVATPRIPSRASVAKQATVKNAINLGKVNLIGVFGSTSNRRALVRLPSGKFIKVKVGDRVDGGRVASISQSELSYTKGGRRVTLNMPSG